MTVNRSAKAVHENTFVEIVALQDSYAWLENYRFLLFCSDRQKVSMVGRSYRPFTFAYRAQHRETNTPTFVAEK